MKFRNCDTIFLLCEVFNTSVDKSVENGGFSRANYIFLSSLKRFALFGCKNSVQKISQTQNRDQERAAKNFLATQIGDSLSTT